LQGFASGRTGKVIEYDFAANSARASAIKNYRASAVPKTSVISKITGNSESFVRRI